MRHHRDKKSISLPTRLTVSLLFNSNFNPKHVEVSSTYKRDMTTSKLRKSFPQIVFVYFPQHETKLYSPSRVIKTRRKEKSNEDDRTSLERVRLIGIIWCRKYKVFPFGLFLGVRRTSVVYQ